jgi:hypothetical protein
MLVLPPVDGIPPVIAVSPVAVVPPASVVPPVARVPPSDVVPAPEIVPPVMVDAPAVLPLATVPPTGLLPSVEVMPPALARPPVCVTPPLPGAEVPAVPPRDASGAFAEEPDPPQAQTRRQKQGMTLRILGMGAPGLLVSHRVYVMLYLVPAGSLSFACQRCGDRRQRFRPNKSEEAGTQH